eukprot:GHVU01034450.1.p1 GENE.GHVU01034450.1~~GHVU01034450.1.p1  ORF type:complete len:200 (+),score=15.47 GHVU01034450.1:502-1101(+)
MVTMARYIDREWRPRRVLLGFVRVEYPHDASKLATEVEAATARFNIPQSVVSAVTTDRASNNDCMMDQLQVLRPNIQWVPCWGHLIHHAVIAGVGASLVLSKTLSLLRFWASHLNVSPKLREAFERHITISNAGKRRQEKLRHRTIPLDVSSRWNSMHRMVHVGLLCREPLAALIHQVGYCPRGTHPFKMTKTNARAHK